MNMWSTPWVDRRLNCAKHVVPAVVSYVLANPAEIMIQTEERTLAAYIAKPVSDSMSRAFREQ